MKKYKVYGVLGILVAICVILLIQATTSSSDDLSIKVSADYVSDQDLLQKAEIVVEANINRKAKSVHYEGVEFTIYDAVLLDVVDGKDKKENETIKILQTDVNSEEFPDLETNTSYLLFLDSYQGPIMENGYVICGMNLGMLKEEGSQIQWNDAQQQAFTVLKTQTKNNDSIHEIKSLILQHR